MTENYSDNVITPNLSVYGDSFARLDSDNELRLARGPFDLEDGTRGDIDRDKLNINLNSDQEELTEFEKSISDYVLSMLGHPVVRVELAPQNIKACIHEAITKLYYHAPSWTTQMAVFSTVPGHNLYKLPLSVVDNLSYVAYKKTLLTIQQQSGTLEFDFFIKYFQDNFLFNNFGLGDFQLLQMHLEQVRKILGQEGSFDIINGQYLQIYPRPVLSEEVVLIYHALDSNTIHPAYRNWIQRYALAVAMGVLGRIRGKHKILPGPGGGTQLDGSELREESLKMKEKLEEELLLEIEEPPLFSMF